MIKESGRIPWGTVAGVLGLGTAGALFGYHVSPRLLDYADDPGSRRLGSVLSALSATVLADSKARALIKAKPALAGIMFGTQELFPRLFKATGELPHAIEASTLVNQLKKMSPGSDVLKGLGLGATTAGLGSLVSASTRRKTPKEEEAKTTRHQMVKSDFMKYLIPGLLAGGVGGKLLLPKG